MGFFSGMREGWKLTAPPAKIPSWEEVGQIIGGLAWILGVPCLIVGTFFWVIS